MWTRPARSGPRGSWWSMLPRGTPRPGLPPPAPPARRGVPGPWRTAGTGGGRSGWRETWWPRRRQAVGVVADARGGPSIRWPGPVRPAAGQAAAQPSRPACGGPCTGPAAGRAGPRSRAATRAGSRRSARGCRSAQSGPTGRPGRSVHRRACAAPAPGPRRAARQATRPGGAGPRHDPGQPGPRRPASPDPPARPDGPAEPSGDADASSLATISASTIRYAHGPEQTTSSRSPAAVTSRSHRDGSVPTTPPGTHAATPHAAHCATTPVYRHGAHDHAAPIATSTAPQSGHRGPADGSSATATTRNSAIHGP